MDSNTDNLSPLKRAIIEIRELRAQLDEIQQARTEPIAIVGMGLRFPGGANDPESFWRILRDGVDTISEVPPDRWDIDAYYDPDTNAPGKMSTRYGAWLERIDQFDAPFFGISPREAASMDPQQRLLLEVSWEALEHAGQSPDKLADSPTGVFLGIANSDYYRMLLADPASIDVYTTTGNALSVAAGRLSYLLGLHGPNIAVDTACSASLVAVHLAVQSLRSGECRLALAGGVSLIITPEVSINFSRSQMMAPDGRCKTFDARADGYVRGEGCGLIVLKRLSDALAEGDEILAVIRGTAINHDGRSSGLTAPNGLAQEAVIRAALANAGLEPHAVSYVETHGTGTSLGDPIEVGALGNVFSPDRDRSKPLAIGSVKTNVGHLEAAAGIAGLIKAALMIRHSEIPPHLHFEQPSPYIDWSLPLTVPTTRAPWTAESRIAGVSSFGLSGTNAHVIVEQAPKGDPHPNPSPYEGEGSGVRVSERPLHLLALSAKSDAALKELAARYINHLTNPAERGASSQPSIPLANLCFTANAGRSHFAHRLAVVSQSVEQALGSITAFLNGQASVDIFARPILQLPNDPTHIVFLFTGHGSLYTGMGRQLYETQPAFRAAMDRCDEILRAYLDESITALLYPDSQTAIPLRFAPGTTLALPARASVVHNPQAIIEDMDYSQCALFALEYALATLWRSWGIEPAAVMGHSLGEYVAACIAGVFSLEDALKLVAARGRLMQALPDDGEMVTVFADEARVAAVVAPYAADVSIAAINSPETVVISGRRAAMQQAIAELKKQKIRLRPLPITRAAHSPMVEPMLDAFEAVDREVRFSPPRIALVSSMTGRPVSDEVTHPDYWRHHLRQPVRFVDALRTLYAQGHRLFVEIGPNPTLLALGQRCVPDTDPALWLPSLREGWADWQQLLESLAALYVNGAAVDWAGFDKDYARRKMPLPTYPFEHKSYWIDQPSNHPTPQSGAQAAIQPSNSFQSSPADSARRQSQQAPLDFAPHTYADKWRVMHRLAVAYAANTLSALGAFARSDERESVDGLISRFNILPTYRGLLIRWLKKLANEGMLQAGADGAFTSPAPLPIVALEPLWDAARRTLADMPAFIDYLRDCGDKVQGILTGRDSPLETLFPGGSFARAEALYQDWVVARYFNRIIGEAVKSMAQPGRPLRVVEIGAGTGSTTHHVLPSLPPDQTVYHFTDVSDLFLDRAREKFADYPFVRYGLLNVEQAPQTQGYGQHSFDVVIAANVLHATANLNETLRNVVALLAPNGRLVLFETTTHQSWFDLTTGLIEGWQRFEDALRADQDHPLLSPEQWAAVLRAEGFAEVVVLPEAGSPAEILGQHVFLARPPQSLVAEANELPTVGEQTAPAIQTEAQALAIDLLRQLHDALPDERQDILIDFVRGHVAAILRLDPSDPLDRRARLMDLGVDSLMAVELRSRLSKGLGLTSNLPATLIFDYPTVEAIADYLLHDVLKLEEAQDEGSKKQEARGKEQEAGSNGIESLSDEEVEALLMQKLQAMK
ncbi:MAG TPA: beta-ketoacyl synthase N-terminal-like domain-containing protein [Anaerolineae bacterium]|nr:beta-ketoacyl synthase N-terminal-like domain-containing protein [Anaerolineae bacterium]